ncbi:uncharacterized protein LOC123681898 [Harmonia axyridis]|uniref:uncharacterized protein LOC123681898 n=1 Tax=Harmonia axyridis TaxID=115357 RepID=UPI001E2770E0|nr:uncharacterized protein LOC123681898 [Harmonia axyridis]
MCSVIELLVIENGALNDLGYIQDVLQEAVVPYTPFVGDDFLLQDLNEKSKEIGLKMNLDRTKIMSHSQEDVTIDNISIEKVEQYVYLGHMIKNGKENQILENGRRMRLAWAAFGKLSFIFKDKNVPLLLKRKAYDSYDTTLVSHAKTLKTCTRKLQELLDELSNWFRKWRMKINPDKSQFIIFDHKISPASPTLKINGKSIKPVPAIKYLGMNIDCKLNFNLHTKLMKRKTISRAKYFSKLVYRKQGINIKSASIIYKTICRPLLEYAHPVFANCKPPAIKNLTVAETTALRTITRMRHPRNPLHNPPNSLLYLNTRIEPIEIRMSRLNKAFYNSRIRIQKRINRSKGHSGHLTGKRGKINESCWRLLMSLWCVLAAAHVLQIQNGNKRIKERTFETMTARFDRCFISEAVATPRSN